MSSTDVLGIVSIVAFVLSGILLVIAVILFFKLRVPAIIDDLSGRKAERQIREMREQNRQILSGNKGRIVYEASIDRASGTERTSPAGKMTDSGKTTSRLPFGKRKEIEEGTSLLEQEEGTSLLGQEEGTSLLGQEEGTSLLEQEEGTTLLGGNAASLPNSYQILINAMVIHTKEWI